MPRVSNGRLGFHRSRQRTAVSTAYAESPLRILTPNNHGDAAWAYTSTLGGGLVDGDRLHLDIALEANARALVTTQAATRVYRSASHASGGCSSSVHARVGEGGALFLLPDPVACFAGASYAQRTEILLEKDASVVSWDLLTAGRAANGERWAFKTYRSAFSVRRAGRSIVDEALLLDPAQGTIAERMGRFDALATLFLCGPLFANAIEILRAQIDREPLLPRASVFAVASPIGADALLVRLAASTVGALLLTLRAQMASIPLLLGDDPWARRN